MPSNPIELQEDNNSALLKQFANDKNTDKKKKPEISDHDVLRESYKGSLFLVLEYVSHDLTGLLDMAYKFTEVQAKSLMMQLLNVLEYMHERKFVHRDLKSSNLLITQNFQVKLAVSGLTS
jgi:serine/threonine protein kinase